MHPNAEQQSPNDSVASPKAEVPGNPSLAANLSDEACRIWAAQVGCKFDGRQDWEQIGTLLAFTCTCNGAARGATFYVPEASSLTDLNEAWNLKWNQFNKAAR